MTGPRLGAHMSIAGGMPEAVVRARSVEATALQVFVKSSNQWAARAFTPGEVETYRRASREAGLDRREPGDMPQAELNAFMVGRAADLGAAAARGPE